MSGKRRDLIAKKLTFGKNITYKVCPVDDIECSTTDAVYDIELKYDKGFVEISMSPYIDEKIIKDILSNVKIY